MLNRIVHFSLRFRGVVVALACVIVGYGLYVATHAKLDVLPNFVPPQVVVQTESPGLSPEQVEVLVTRPLENTINGLGNMASLRSESISGLSVITAVFKEGTDIFIARQMLNEKLGDWTVKPRLLSVPGVARCIVFGGEVRQLQIQVRPERLMAYGLAISDVLGAARVATGVMGAG